MASSPRCPCRGRVFFCPCRWSGRKRIAAGGVSIAVAMAVLARGRARAARAADRPG